MKNLFGEGRHPDADTLAADLVAAGATAEAAVRATRLGRRFPQYQARPGVARKVAEARAAEERRLDRPLSEQERLSGPPHRVGGGVSASAWSGGDRSGRAGGGGAGGCWAAGGGGRLRPGVHPGEVGGGAVGDRVGGDPAGDLRRPHRRRQ